MVKLASGGGLAFSQNEGVVLDYALNNEKTWFSSSSQVSKRNGMAVMAFMFWCVPEVMRFWVSETKKLTNKFWVVRHSPPMANGYTERRDF